MAHLSSEPRPTRAPARPRRWPWVVTAVVVAVIAVVGAGWWQLNQAVELDPAPAAVSTPTTQPTVPPTPEASQQDLRDTIWAVWMVYSDAEFYDQACESVEIFSDDMMLGMTYSMLWRSDLEGVEETEHVDWSSQDTWQVVADTITEACTVSHP